MTATVLPFKAKERAKEAAAAVLARAALAALDPEKRVAVLRLRYLVVSYATAGRKLRQEDPLTAMAHEEVADMVDKDTCTLMGFNDFSLRDVPEDCR